MILSCFRQHWPERLAYLEAPPEAQVDARMRDVQDDVTRSLKRRASFTREHLEENGLKENYAMAGLEGVNESSDDLTLVKAVVKLQMSLFPGNVKEQDGMYGQRTFEAYRKTLVGDALSSLQQKVKQAREERLVAEGPMVQHDQIADEIRTQYHITVDVISAAERECARNGELNEILERKNFLRLVDYAAHVTDVPPSAIIATTYAEVSGSFYPTEFGPVEELGMGQFLKKYWDDYRGHEKFKTEMAKFTAQVPETIGRARSIVGDLLAIGIKLKQSERVVGEFHYDTKLTTDQLTRMRFHYHAPGYAAVYYGKANRGSDYKASADAAYERYKYRYESRFADKAGTIDNQVRQAIAALG